MTHRDGIIKSLSGCSAKASEMDCSDFESEESERALQLIDGASEFKFVCSVTGGMRPSGQSADFNFKFLCSVTGGPRPSGQSADFNFKLFDYCGLAPADSIINCGSERLVPMFSPETTVGNRAFRVGAQSWLSHGPSELRKISFSQIRQFSDGV